MSLIQQNMGAIYDGSQRLIAPVLNSTTATQNWAVGQEFILDGNLYKVTTAISSGSQIIVSGSSANCELADTVTEQMRAKRLTKASSWEDAKSKANSYVLVKMYGVMGAPNRTFTHIIPKEDFSSGSYFTTGFMYNDANYGLATFRPSTARTDAFYVGADVSSSFTTEFYYDS